MGLLARAPSGPDDSPADGPDSAQREETAAAPVARDRTVRAGYDHLDPGERHVERVHHDRVRRARRRVDLLVDAELEDAQNLVPLVRLARDPDRHPGDAEVRDVGRTRRPVAGRLALRVPEA